MDENQKRADRVAVRRGKLPKRAPRPQRPRVRPGTTCAECGSSSRHESWCKRSD